MSRPELQDQIDELRGQVESLLVGECEVQNAGVEPIPSPSIGLPRRTLPPPPPPPRPSAAERNSRSDNQKGEYSALLKEIIDSTWKQEIELYERRIKELEHRNRSLELGLKELKRQLEMHDGFRRE